jgi:hypothetical protein
MWRAAHHPTIPSRRDLLAGLAGTGLAATAGCLADDDQFSAGSDATTDWPMARHDPANTAYAPDAVAPRTGVTERWRKKVGSRVDGIVPADNGVVVNTFGGPLRNLKEGHGGRTDWTAEDRHARSPPVKTSSWVYSAGWDAVSSLRVYDKNLHWRADGDFGSTAPVAAGDTLYVPSQDTIHAYDLGGGTGGGGLTFGAERWSQSLDVNFVQGLAVGDGALFAACEATESGDSLVCPDPA